MTRAEILDEAKRIITQDRQDSYGNPEDSFGVIADFWTTYLKGKGKLSAGIDRLDVSMMMELLKIARETTGHKMDNLIDMAGYAACAGEIAAALDEKQ